MLERRITEGEGPKKVFGLISFGQVSLSWFFGGVLRLIDFLGHGESEMRWHEELLSGISSELLGSGRV